MGVNDYPQFLGKTELYDIIGRAQTIQATLDGNVSNMLSSIKSLETTINGTLNSVQITVNGINTNLSSLIQEMSNTGNSELVTVLQGIETWLTEQEQALKTYVDSAYGSAKDYLDMGYKDYQAAMQLMYDKQTKVVDSYNSVIVDELKLIDTEVNNQMVYTGALVGIAFQDLITVAQTINSGNEQFIRDMITQNTQGMREVLQDAVLPFRLLYEDIKADLAGVANFTASDLLDTITGMLENTKGSLDNLMRRV
jgi:hypothetical protein